MKKKLISTSTTGPYAFQDPDTMLILVKDVLLYSDREGIVASGNAPDRMIVINGELTAGGTGIVFGSGAAGDIHGSVVVSGTGAINAQRAGITAIADGMEIINRGGISAKLTGVIVTGAGAQITNEGSITSGASNAIDIHGAKSMIVNNGAIDGTKDTILVAGDRANVTNNGRIGSTTADAIHLTGAKGLVTNNGTIGNKGDGIFVSGTADTITNNGKIGSGGSAIIARGKDQIVTNSGALNAGKDGIALVGDEGIVTNRKSIEVGGVALRIAADDAIVNNTGSAKGAIGLLVTGAHVDAANRGTIFGWKGAAVDLSKASGGTFDNAGTLISASGATLVGGQGKQTIVNSGTIKGDVDLYGSNDYFDNRGGVVMGHIAGGKGNDTYVIDDAKTLLLEAANGGHDTVQSTKSYTLGANFEVLTLIGHGTINGAGNAANNGLNGNDAANMLNGMGGKDTLWGGLGADILTGGTGADQFVFKAVEESTLRHPDVITDFSRKEGDRINLSAIDANTLRPGDQTFHFIGEKEFHKKAGELHVDYAKGATVLSGDVNGDGKADFAIKLQGHLTFDNGSFIL
ncbi:calcium-binding protein [Rhizobium sp. CC-YZS058]|uniref:calcium-binding protein n=1 Tax=Rhizobium sp. CC-YZS058 TaxID=3042153 RepID=UPI002B0620BE|nr:calcium-binding protein [Rhizobium sp. CC-YZS058]MEA3533349.1 calcium-binding protein [Rhizobium sp. CC-YZS058]